MTTNHDDRAAILTRAVLRKRASKAEGLAAVKRLIEIELAKPVNAIPELGDRDPAMFDELVTLYSHFMPAKPGKARDAFSWVASAVADSKDCRYYLHHVYADGSRIIGTNGHRLHIAPDARAAGFYCARTGEPIECDGTYPDVDRVIPKQCEGAPIELDQASLNAHTSYMVGKTQKVACTITRGDILAGFDRQYMLAALTLHGAGTARLRSGTDALRIDLPGDCIAVVMPIRL